MSRDKSIDIARGIGIILVVLGHSGMPYSSIIFRFHMALFFIISGWCFSDKHLQDFKSVLYMILKKIKGLYLPFVLFNSITLLLQNIFIQINLYTDNPLFLEESSFGGNAYGITNTITLNEMINRIVFYILPFGKGETQLGGATWFLRVLFGVTIMWSVINWILKTVAKFNEAMRLYINIVLSVFLLYASWQWIQEGHLFKTQFETMASSYIMFCTGYYLSKSYPHMHKIQNGVMALLSILILLYCDKICNKYLWDSNVNTFANPIMYVISSFAGLGGALSISQLVNNCKLFRIVEVIGQHSLCILLFHFLSFKIVTLFQILIYQQPLYRLASFPVYNSGNFWWIAYTLCGIFVPLCMAIAYTKCRETISVEKN